MTASILNRPPLAPDLVGDEVDLSRVPRIDLATYRRMAEAGLLDSLGRIELISGLMVSKMTKHPPHVVATCLAEQWFPRVLPAGWFLSAGNPIILPDSESEPEPDLMVVRGDPRDYLDHLPGTADVAIVLEVSDSSYRYDRGTKYRVYAHGGAPIYWLLDINRRVLLVFSDPTGPADDPGYRAATTHGPDDEVPLVLDGREVARLAVRDILP